MTINIQHLQSIKKEHQRHGLQLCQTLINDLKEFENSLFSHPAAKDTFLDTLHFISDGQRIDGRSFYFLKQLDSLLYLMEMLEVLQQVNEPDQTDEDMPSEEDLFDFWNSSHFAQTFSEGLNQGPADLQQLLSLSHKLSALYQETLISFCLLHILNQNFRQENTYNALVYRALEELGDCQHALTFGRSLTQYPIDQLNTETSFPFFRIDSFSQKSSQLSLEQDEKIFVIHGKELAVFNTEGFKYSLINNIKEIETDLFQQKIDKALQLINKASPICFNALNLFSNIFVLHGEAEMVSYSTQDLPGVSVINGINRDFVDLIDDLVHENGHHFLNACLDLNELIYEDDEQVFYSPWRNALRPIRGIYHGYCTFAWAYKLFSDLIKYFQNEGVHDLLSDQEIQKIQLRANEEKEMLDRSQKEVEKAIQMGKVSPEGIEVFRQFEKMVQESLF